MARPGPSSRGQLHVGRYLGALLVLLVVLYTLVWVAGPGGKPLTPTLGLDLKGGSSVILQARPDGGKAPTQSQLDTAVSIIRQRVNGAGVSEAEVVVQGSNLVVSVPGGNRSDIKNVTQTAQLRFREVLQATGPAPVSAGTPSTTPTASPPVAAPTPAPSSASAPATPAPSASTAPRAVTSGLLAAGTPTPAATSTAAAPTASATPAPAATPTAAATPAPAATPAVDAATAFATLDCTKAANRQGGGASDQANQQIAACDRNGTEKYLLDVAKVVGTDVKGATAQLPQSGTGGWEVSVSFTGKGQDKFTNLTAATVGKRVAIVLDGVVVSAPTIQQRIDSNAQITGSFTQKTAQDLANVLKYGSLPLTFVPQEEQTVSPTLGKDQLRSGLVAGGIGLLAVVAYSLLYYRAMGLVTIASLLVSGALTYAAICLLAKQIGFALSLAGIAGFIVAVGITADSFVVFFERLKDEIKEGRTPRSAVDRAWVRARRTILSADTVSLLAAVILYFVSVGNVRGFAFTLGLSTLLDVLVVFLFTRPLVSYLSRYRWFSRSGPTGFHGPDGGQPVTQTAPSRRRGTPSEPLPGSRPATVTSEA